MERFIIIDGSPADPEDSTYETVLMDSEDQSELLGEVDKLTAAGYGVWIVGNNDTSAVLYRKKPEEEA